MPGNTKNTKQPPAQGQSPTPPLPPVTNIVEQNVVPVVSEAQRLAAQSSVSGRHAVSRGTIFLAFYLWILSGAILFSFIARYTQLFPGDTFITHRLQRQRNRWFYNFMLGISEIGFPKIFTPITIGVAAIFWALRFRLESIFVLLTSTSGILNAIVKRLIKRPRPTKELVTVVRVINEPSFPSGHVMHYTNFFGLMIYLLATNWRSGKLRNALIAVCTTLIALIGPSRVYLGAHWPSDVMAGYIYGGLWFAGLMTIYLRIKAWIHPLQGKTPEVMKSLQQPGDEE
ncbi:MAG TPA: phosphatase PAP2 family protein [Ktedonobacteraceae bacterium]|jgi:membrane-associated phospholipid phosphatase|nr:phosphatase PAP2 family protein [Ktedonobacteraceae bacterium]